MKKSVLCRFTRACNIFFLLQLFNKWKQAPSVYVLFGSEWSAKSDAEVRVSPRGTPCVLLWHDILEKSEVPGLRFANQNYPHTYAAICIRFFPSSTFLNISINPNVCANGIAILQKTKMPLAPENCTRVLFWWAMHLHCGESKHACPTGVDVTSSTSQLHIPRLVCILNLIFTVLYILFRAGARCNTSAVNQYSLYSRKAFVNAQPPFLPRLVGGGGGREFLAFSYKEEGESGSVLRNTF